MVDEYDMLIQLHSCVQWKACQYLRSLQCLTESLLQPLGKYVASVATSFLAHWAGMSACCFTSTASRSCRVEVRIEPSLSPQHTRIHTHTSTHTYSQIHKCHTHFYTQTLQTCTYSPLPQPPPTGWGIGPEEKIRKLLSAFNHSILYNNYSVGFFNVSLKLF